MCKKYTYAATRDLHKNQVVKVSLGGSLPGGGGVARRSKASPPCLPSGPTETSGMWWGPLTQYKFSLKFCLVALQKVLTLVLPY